jgi:hypothetical protein
MNVATSLLSLTPVNSLRDFYASCMLWLYPWAPLPALANSLLKTPSAPQPLSSCPNKPSPSSRLPDTCTSSPFHFPAQSMVLYIINTAKILHKSERSPVALAHLGERQTEAILAIGKLWFYRTKSGGTVFDPQKRQFFSFCMEVWLDFCEPHACFQWSSWCVVNEKSVYNDVDDIHLFFHCTHCTLQCSVIEGTVSTHT